MIANAQSVVVQQQQQQQQQTSHRTARVLSNPLSVGAGQKRALTLDAEYCDR